MSTALSNGGGVAEYVRRIATANPAEAVQIALAEAEREKAIAAQDRTEYLAMADVKFNHDGSIANANLGGLYRLAQMYSRTGMVPEQYRGKPDDCFIACQMAFRLGIDPLAYMQASYVVHGKPGIEAKLAIALLNKSGKIRGRLRWKYEGAGQTRQCTAYATDAETGDTVESTVTWVMVKAEKWDSKAGSKWITIPDIMFGYRSAAFLIRQYYPEVLMGISTNEELEDRAPRREEAAKASTVEGLLNQWQGQRTGLPQPDEQPESSDGREPAGEAETLSPNAGAGSEAKSGTPAAPSKAPIDWRSLDMDLDNCEKLGDVNDVMESYVADANELERTQVMDRCEARKKAIKASRGAGSKAPVGAA